MTQLGLGNTWIWKRTMSLIFLTNHLSIYMYGFFLETGVLFKQSVDTHGVWYRNESCLC